MRKIFYLINEHFEGYQTGYRNALSKLKNARIIDDVKYFSFIPEEKKCGNWQTALTIVGNQILEYKPTIILVAHLSRHHAVPKQFVDNINSTLTQRPVWVYDERDVYGVIRKPLSKNILTFASYCDAVILCTYGSLLKRFEKWGSKRIFYLPHVYDDNFGTQWIPAKDREYDVIMIANRSKSRIPFKSMPGIKEREQIVKIFAVKFGKRFAVYGRGWDGYPSASGPINFFDQENIIRTSWLTIGMDHFYNYNGYYSDRLPIALVSGVPHLTYKTPGLEKLFIDRKHLFYFRSPEEALHIAVSLLQGNRDELIRFGEVARAYVIDRFSETERYKKILDICVGINRSIER